MKRIVSCGLCLMACLLAASAGSLKPPLSDQFEALSTHWTDAVSARQGQLCDAATDTLGCAAVWVSEVTDPFTVKDLPLNQQDGFQNTQHRLASWNFEGYGMKADSLPRGSHHLNPVCYITRNQDTSELSLGYEEGNGDKILPCPGGNGAVPWTEEQILAATRDEDLMQDMCTECYHAVCSSQRSRNPRLCGGSSQGGLDVGQGNGGVAVMVQQATPAYHCHLTMQNEGACDFVQYNQHERDREYNMSSGVLCGWEKVRTLNITYCDCTKEAGRENRCAQSHCLAMAEQGVVCGNCGGCNQNIAYQQIFEPVDPEPERLYDGVCSLVRTLPDGSERNRARMLCSQGLFCRSYSERSSNCQFHCSNFPSDPRCPQSRRRQLLRAIGWEDLTGKHPGASGYLDLDSDLELFDEEGEPLPDKEEEMQ